MKATVAWFWVHVNENGYIPVKRYPYHNPKNCDTQFPKLELFFLHSRPNHRNIFRKRIQVAKTALNQAEESLRIVKNRYKNGLLTIVGLLDAEVARQQAHTDYFKALHDFKVAGIELALASGTIDADFQ